MQAIHILGDDGIAFTWVDPTGECLVAKVGLMAFRDPNGIRPAYFYEDDEVVVVASERPAIQTVFNVQLDEIKELDRGHALVIKKNGKTTVASILKQREKKSCSFERIYFSRGSDASIYEERKNLGKYVFSQVLKSIDNDISNTVFSC